MAGLEVSRVQAEQNTTTSRKQQAKQENIVIEFSSLPNNLKTKEVRKFYDKDGSGLLESNNWNGQNEVTLMADAFKLDLSKYASKDIIKTVNDIGTRCYDANGKLTHVYDGTSLWEANNSTPYKKYDYKYTRGYRDDDYSLMFEQKYKKNGSFEVIAYDKFGNTMKMTDLYKTATIYNKDGKEIAKLTRNQDDYNSVIRIFDGNKVELVKGKNTLIQVQDVEVDGLDMVDYQYYGKSFDIENLLKNAKYQKPVGSIKYLYNGNEVQAKPIGKGRYEVTDEKGNVFYISHDGVNLKPEYVRNNP